MTKMLVETLDFLGSWGILTTDCELRITGWNRWLETQSGRIARSVVGRDLREIFPDLRERELDSHYHKALEGQAQVLSQRFHQFLLPLPPTMAGSSLKHMQQTAIVSPLITDNRVAGTLTLIEDVTERVVIEQELRQQAQRLEDANRHKDEFLAMLAHELRNPLAPISNGVAVLEGYAADSPEAGETRRMIQRQVSHMARLIDDLLDVSRIVRGKVRLQKAVCDLSRLMQEVAQDYRPILADNGLELTVEITPGCILEGDSVRLTQVIGNLLHNSSKFTNRGGRVQLKLELHPEMSEARIIVADNGIGMSSQTLARVFDAFSQAESSLARSKGGLGLGLALVKGLAELHGGRVTASSAGLMQGSHFTVYLPWSGDTSSRPDVQPPAPAAEPRGVKRVLVIEDNRDTAFTMQILIRRLGYQVEIAGTGLKGVELARALQPDVVICDLGLPEMDGFGVARMLRSEAATRNAFLIAQSGYGQTEDVRKSLEAGFDLHLIKPVDVADLERILRESGSGEDL